MALTRSAEPSLCITQGAWGGIRVQMLREHKMGLLAAPKPSLLEHKASARQRLLC